MFFGGFVIDLFLANGLSEALEPVCESSYQPVRCEEQDHEAGGYITFHLQHKQPCRMREKERIAGQQWTHVDKHSKDYPEPSARSGEPA